jgi:protein involved in polysaccharide export with SLBB domain
VSKAIKHQGSKDDIILEDKDEIVIPAMSAAISVSGAVIQPSSLVYIECKKAKDYVKMVGGYSRDADKDAIYVIKANGMVVSSEKAKLGPGDLIIVPTKIMVERVTDRWGQIIGAVKFAVTTLAMVYTIKLIAERI